ncbi:hypothetical protein SEA_KASHFLOW_104 [Mycobacterium phage KashFlow]|nr:hypothetical protein PORCELAIN_105 [Mycobacterium phage Porcelain]QPO16710.1 hypothetical protein SEA_KASHFLOW_104 [Mycobacterium phage KashFlow]
MISPKIIGSAAVVGLLALSACSTMNHETHTGCTVKAKDIILDGDGGGGITKTKRLSTTCGSFDVEDNIAGGFNSWDIWASLEVGKTYTIESGGYRVGFFSMFPNVLKATEE